jgi:hypothetical protein
MNADPKLYFSPKYVDVAEEGDILVHKAGSNLPRQAPQANNFEFLNAAKV